MRTHGRRNGSESSTNDVSRADVSSSSGCFRLRPTDAGELDELLDAEGYSEAAEADDH